MCSLVTDEVQKQIKQTVLNLKEKNEVKNYLKELLISLDPIFAEID